MPINISSVLFEILNIKAELVDEYQWDEYQMEAGKRMIFRQQPSWQPQSDELHHRKLLELLQDMEG